MRRAPGGHQDGPLRQLGGGGRCQQGRGVWMGWCSGGGRSHQQQHVWYAGILQTPPPFNHSSSMPPSAHGSSALAVRGRLLTAGVYCDAGGSSSCSPCAGLFLWWPSVAVLQRSSLPPSTRHAPSCVGVPGWVFRIHCSPLSCGMAAPAAGVTPVFWSPPAGGCSACPCSLCKRGEVVRALPCDAP